MFAIGQSVRANRRAVCRTDRLLQRAVMPGDRLTVVRHGTDFLLCQQAGESGCRVWVPTEALNATADDPDANDGDNVGCGPVGETEAAAALPGSTKRRGYPPPRRVA